GYCFPAFHAVRNPFNRHASTSSAFSWRALHRAPLRATAVAVCPTGSGAESPESRLPGFVRDARPAPGRTPAPPPTTRCDKGGDGGVSSHRRETARPTGLRSGG